MEDMSQDTYEPSLTPAMLTAVSLCVGSREIRKVIIRYTKGQSTCSAAVCWFGPSLNALHLSDNASCTSKTSN